jgi:hypothetical protein
MRTAASSATSTCQLAGEKTGNLGKGEGKTLGGFTEMTNRLPIILVIHEFLREYLARKD